MIEKYNLVVQNKKDAKKRLFYYQCYQMVKV